MDIIDSKLLDRLTEEAKASDRLRINHNFHKSLDDKCQRLLNAMEPGTIMPIHHHKVDEMYIVLRGDLTVTYHDDHKNITESHRICPREGNFGIQIPAGTWHSCALQLHTPYSSASARDDTKNGSKNDVDGGSEVTAKNGFAITAEVMKSRRYEYNKAEDLSTLGTQILRSYRRFAGSLYPAVMDFDGKMTLDCKILEELSVRQDLNPYDREAFRLALAFNRHLTDD